MSETVLMALRGDRVDRQESEPVVVDQRGDTVYLVLDDGETLEFDARELRASLGEAA